MNNTGYPAFNYDVFKSMYDTGKTIKNVVADFNQEKIVIKTDKEAEDDPEIEIFKDMHMKGIIQLRPMSGPVGAERFAEYIFNKLNDFVHEETEGRVSVTKVEFFENKKNTAIYAE